MQRVTGVVISWSEDEGWGTLRSDSAPSDVFALFSDLDMEGYHALQPGQKVEFLLEDYPRGQDGCVFRAEEVRVIGR
ncbi:MULTISPECIES: cold-shock protein [unclassified Frondihabitans]|uniref:cold-shock protein n=1 Tax=unclassified Frondihabitans TaxID=2626248 RepID=UPI000F4E308B|nr:MULTISPECIES: cold shock domain-containing protein [unclassified Frondihabitans]RPE76052.1 CspA family cold shock protein [Frondihabitans sp. PhB153]RPF05671.1 CspA family cold shock protein [Frondihabitans sp. PhB161]